MLFQMTPHSLLLQVAFYFFLIIENHWFYIGLLWDYAPNAETADRVI